MCPWSALEDQNFLPHTLHGSVIKGASGSGLGLGEEEEPVSLLEVLLVRFLLGVWL